MILHHNPLERSSNPNAIQLCGSLAIETVDAIVLYMDRYFCIGQMGYFSSATLVECICHLIPSIVFKVPQEHSQAAVVALGKARELLLRLSTHHGAAKRAQKVLESIFAAVRRLPASQGLEMTGPETIGAGGKHRFDTPFSVPAKMPSDALGKETTVDSSIPDLGASRKRKIDVDDLESLDCLTDNSLFSLEWASPDFSDDWLLNSSWMDLAWLPGCDTINNT